jgi:hypothetical protein
MGHIVRETCFMKVQQFRRAAVALVCAMSMSIVACGGDDGPVTPQAIAGTYTATQLTTTTNGVTTNQLAAGATVTLVLNADGSAGGRLFVPASTIPGVDVSLNGTWGYSNGDVDLTSTTDTFLQDMLFSVQGNTLVGDQTFGTTRIQIVLTKL